MNQLYSVVLLSVSLVGCGGGGSESTADAPPLGASVSQSNQVVSVQVPSQPAVTEFSLEANKPLSLARSGSVIKSTAQASREIIVPDNFALNSERQLTLRVSRSKYNSQPAYLSLCSDYKHYNDGSYSINYDSCLLRTSLGDIHFEADITVTNDTKGLVAALWFMDENKAPLIKDWRF
jgi:hypothetical protein